MHIDFPSNVRLADVGTIRLAIVESGGVRGRSRPSSRDQPEDKEKPEPLRGKELSGTWQGEKENVIKARITFRGTDDAKW